jgi:hypothetical protein
MVDSEAGATTISIPIDDSVIHASGKGGAEFVISAEISGLQMGDIASSISISGEVSSVL